MGGWVLYGIVFAAVVVICLLFILMRARALAAGIGRLADDVASLGARVAGVEGKAAGPAEPAAAVDEKVSARVEATAAELRDLISKQRADLGAAISKLEGQLAEARAAAPPSGPPPGAAQGVPPTELLTPEVALAHVIEPPTWEFLRELKSELQLGLSRVERLERVLLKREAGEAPALGRSEEALPAEEPEEEAEFEEWEQEAKELAETEEPDEVAAPATEPYREPPTEYPGEMGETGAEPPTEVLEEDLYEDEDIGLPEIEDEEEPKQ